MRSSSPRRGRACSEAAVRARTRRRPELEQRPPPLRRGRRGTEASSPRAARARGRRRAPAVPGSGTAGQLGDRPTPPASMAEHLTSTRAERLPAAVTTAGAGQLLDRSSTTQQNNKTGPLQPEAEDRSPQRLERSGRSRRALERLAGGARSRGLAYVGPVALERRHAGLIAGGARLACDRVGNRDVVTETASTTVEGSAPGSKYRRSGPDRGRVRVEGEKRATPTARRRAPLLRA